MTQYVKPGLLAGIVRAPASKSAIQRAIAIAALAKGQSKLFNIGLSKDAEAAIRAVTALGADPELCKDYISITGLADQNGKIREPGKNIELSCGESGLSLRMFSAIAALFSSRVSLNGEGSLLSRPVGMAEKALQSIGVECTGNAGYPPLKIKGPLKPGTMSIEAGDSSQFISGLLIALACAGAPSKLEVKGLKSKGYIKLTLDIMRHFGAECYGNIDKGIFELSGSGYKATGYEAEGDWSGAAFLFVAGAIAGQAATKGLEITGLKPDSSQPDRAILEALNLAGVSVTQEGGSFFVKPGQVKAFHFDASHCPDLFPPLVALAAMAEGNSFIKGADRLTNKESNRAKSLEEEYSKLGVVIKTEQDVMSIRGCAGRQPAGGVEVSSHNDHRIAMALAVSALRAKKPLLIHGSESVSKSYPDFFRDLEGLLVPG